MIHIVGAGPGRADLLTVRAARLLAQAGAVLYDRLVTAEVLELVRPGAEMIDVGKEEGRQEEIQAWIYERLAECARRHETVVRLKGGDPMVFGRGAEEWARLVEMGYEVELVPGISSAVAVPELAGIPVTYRGVAGGFAVITGHRKDGACTEWAAYAQVETLVVLMGVGQRVEIAACLLKLGRAEETPVAFIENGTTARERVVEATLGEVARGLVAVEAPAVMVVGECVRLRERLRRVAAVSGGRGAVAGGVLIGAGAICENGAGGFGREEGLELPGGAAAGVDPDNHRRVVVANAQGGAPGLVVLVDAEGAIEHGGGEVLAHTAADQGPDEAGRGFEHGGRPDGGVGFEERGDPLGGFFAGAFAEAEDDDGRGGGQDGGERDLVTREGLGRGGWQWGGSEGDGGEEEAEGEGEAHGIHGRVAK